MRHHLAISRIFGIACVKVLSFQTCVHVVKGNYVDAHWCNAPHCFVTWHALLFVKRCVGRCGLFPGPTIPCMGEKKERSQETARNGKLRRTRRLKSFPWDALVYGSIMAFYLGKWNKTKQNIRLLRPGSNPGLQSSIKFQCFNPRWKGNIPRSVSQGDCRLWTADCGLQTADQG